MEYIGKQSSQMSPAWWSVKQYLCRPCDIRGSVETSFEDAGLLDSKETL